MKVSPPAALLSDALQRIQICLVETRATHHHPIIQSIFHVTTVKALQMALFSPFLLNYIAVSLLIWNLNLIDMMILYICKYVFV